MTNWVLTHTKEDHIQKRCLAILKRSNVIRFSRNLVIKHVTRWEPDSDGDLVADWTTGQTLYVCPFAMMYEITEITPKQAEKERETPKRWNKGLAGDILKQEK